MLLDQIMNSSNANDKLAQSVRAQEHIHGSITALIGR